MTTSPDLPDLTAHPPAPMTAPMTARRPEDLLAIAPVLLGFWPQESIVLMTFGARRPFHARIDLPPLTEQTPSVMAYLDDALWEPARRLGARHSILLYFTADRSAAASVHRSLRRGCHRSGIGLLTAIAADGERFVDLSRRPDASSPGTPYDVSAHPLVLEAVASGRLRHRSRQDLVDSLEADPVAVTRTEAALVAGRLHDQGVPSQGRAIRDAGNWVSSKVAELAAAGSQPSEDDAARLLWLMQVLRIRDAAWSLIRRRDAERHARFWADLLVRAPESLAAAPAALLGWAAWQAGDGARAWIAVDRCLRAEPHYALAEHLAGLLRNATPPQEWEGGFDWAIGLP